MIDNETIQEALGLNIEANIACRNVGYIDDNVPELITFIDNIKWIESLEQNTNIKALFTTTEIAHKISKAQITKIIVDDPRYYYFKLYNHIAEKNYRQFKTEIDPTADIHSTAVIADHNVTIAKGVIIDPHVTIYPDVVIGENSIIRASVVIGQHGYEYKKTARGFLSVFHAGRVSIGKNVEIRANTCIDKGLFTHRNTIIGDDTKINTLVMIGHGVQIGRQCLIHTCASISGSSTIGDNVWLSPNATVKNGIMIGNNALIGIGAVVIHDVEAETVVVGNPARFLRKK